MRLRNRIDKRRTEKEVKDILIKRFGREEGLKRYKALLLYRRCCKVKINEKDD